ncbi:hypothetical protein C8Q80DRAFT_180666 [Daedaleopsis nitida]|nr:hypothetical protein C8Q80DRAFT_180666 [Daedaleopsis nitida]
MNRLKRGCTQLRWTRRSDRRHPDETRKTALFLQIDLADVSSIKHALSQYKQEEVVMLTGHRAN